LASKSIDVARLQTELNGAPTGDPPVGDIPSRQQLQAIGCDPRQMNFSVIEVFYDDPPPILLLDMDNFSAACVEVENGERKVHAPPWLLEQYTSIAPGSPPVVTP